jgi:hypothetical protein
MKQPERDKLFRREPTGTAADDWHALRVALVIGVVVFTFWRIVA